MMTLMANSGDAGGVSLLEASAWERGAGPGAVIVCPRSRLGEAFRRAPDARLLTLTSDPAEPAPEGLAEADRLLLAFNDIATPRSGYVAPEGSHVAAALAFAAREARPLIVQCYAGVSRSPAMAYAIACARRPDLDEAAIAGELRRLSPSATPNPRIVALADALLRRDGRMSAAIAALGRGAEAYEGELFALALDRLSAPGARP